MYELLSSWVTKIKFKNLWRELGSTYNLVQIYEIALKIANLRKHDWFWWVCSPPGVSNFKDFLVYKNLGFWCISKPKELERKAYLIFCIIWGPYEKVAEFGSFILRENFVRNHCEFCLSRNSKWYNMEYFIEYWYQLFSCHELIL